MHAPKRPEAPNLPRERPLRRREYEQLVELGAFRDEKIELMYGRLVSMSAHGRAHAFAVSRLTDLLVPRLTGRAKVRIQLPFIAEDESEPEPDVGVFATGDYLDEHPRSAHLLIEVAETTLVYDRVTKGTLYADSGVPEYWIVNLVDGVVERYQQPDNGAYAVRTVHGRGTSLAVPGFEDVELAVADLLPPAPG